MKKFELFGKTLTKDEQKRINGGDESIDPGTGGDCNSTCSSNRDCPSDRYCGSGTCGSQTIKSCFRY